MPISEELYQTKKAYRCNWLKIFHHDIDAGLFKNELEAKYSLTKGKFSILGIINEKFKIDGQYEFLLEYPDKTNKKGMNRWAQKNNPLEEREMLNKKVEGYEPITISWENAISVSNDNREFCGLSRSNISSLTLIDGTCEENTWFFSIGLYQIHDIYRLPGYGTNSEVILWLRIVDTKLKYKMNKLHRHVIVFFSICE